MSLHVWERNSNYPVGMYYTNCAIISPVALWPKEKERLDLTDRDRHTVFIDLAISSDYVFLHNSWGDDLTNLKIEMKDFKNPKKFIRHY